jgi:hypothetical protein
MFENNKDYFADNPQNYSDWSKYPITVFKRTNNYLWIYHKHTLKDNETITENKCKKVKTYLTNGGYEGIKVNDAYFYSR